MQRYFLNDTINDYQDVEIILTDEIYHHMIHVMRMKEAQQIYLVLPKKKAFIAEIIKIDTDKKVVVTHWVSDEVENKELPVEVTLACGISKGEKFDWLVQKATELGMFAFIPLTTQYTVVKWEQKKQDKKVARLQKIAQEAAEQAHRQWVPKIYDLLSIHNLIKQSQQFDICIVAYEEAAKVGEVSQLSKILSTVKPNQKILVVFGPEGGLAPEEVEQLLAADFVICGLGPRILRAETAPLYLLSAVSYVTELQ